MPECRNDIIASGSDIWPRSCPRCQFGPCPNTANKDAHEAVKRPPGEFPQMYPHKSPEDNWLELREEVGRLKAELEAWNYQASRIVQWLPSMSYNDSYFGEPAGRLKQVVAELQRLSK